MKLTSKEVEILKKARWLIENDCDSYICFAIGSVETDDVEHCSDSYHRHSPYYRLSTRINDLLGDDSYALEDWLENEAGISYRQITKKRMRYYRLRWLDHMISTREL